MIMHSAFSAGAGEEHFFTLTPARGETFAGEAEDLLAEYRSAIGRFGCSADSEYLLRFHCSDVVNQAPILKNILKGCDSFVSIIGQPPAEGGRIALEAWHLMPMK